MPHLNEARTRAALINPQLEKAGWNLNDSSQIQLEVPVQGYDPTPWNGFTDFCLYITLTALWLHHYFWEVGLARTTLLRRR